MKPIRNFPEPGTKRPRKVFRYTMAIVGSLLLLIGAWLAWSFYTLSSNRVFIQNYHPYELTILRDPDPSKMSAIEIAYHDKKYKDITTMSRHPDSLSAKDIFLVGICWVEQANSTKAIEFLKRVIFLDERDGSTAMKDDAEYYLALTYIRNKDFDFALELLRKIKDDPQHLYYDQVSRKLIRQVKMLKWR